jgi:SAM-dependent methyltransferase
VRFAGVYRDMKQKLLMLRRKIGVKICSLLGYRLVRLVPFRMPFARRYDYQKVFNDFNIAPGSRVLDIGSGSQPFPFATHIADKFIEPTNHRRTPFVHANLPLTVCGVEQMPFEDKYFDFVYCSHVLEHVDDPIQACREIMRVGKRGYIETPTMMKDALFAWAKGMHKWGVSAVRGTLVFQEYSPRQLEGVRSRIWRDSICGHYSNPLQDLFYSNLDLFNTMITWESTFKVIVIRLDGNVQTLNCE